MSSTIPVQTAASVRTFFENLCDEHRFRIASARYSPEVFGNIQIVASCDCFSIDYRLDRGDESLYLVVRGREYLIADACQLLSNQPLYGESVESEQSFIATNVDRLKDLFSVDGIERSIKKLESLRVDRLHRMYPGSVLDS